MEEINKLAECYERVKQSLRISQHALTYPLYEALKDFPELQKEYRRTKRSFQCLPLELLGIIFVFSVSKWQFSRVCKSWKLASDKFPPVLKPLRTLMIDDRYQHHWLNNSHLISWRDVAPDEEDRYEWDVQALSVQSGKRNSDLAEEMCAGFLGKENHLDDFWHTPDVNSTRLTWFDGEDMVEILSGKVVVANFVSFVKVHLHTAVQHFGDVSNCTICKECNICDFNSASRYALVTCDKTLYRLDFEQPSCYPICDVGGKPAQRHNTLNDTHYVIYRGHYADVHRHLDHALVTRIECKQQITGMYMSNKFLVMKTSVEWLVFLL